MKRNGSLHPPRDKHRDPDIVPAVFDQQRLEESVQRFAAYKPAAALLTKLDEAASLGGTLSALIGANLPVSYVVEGPRIPEDLAPARAHQLVARAVYLAQATDASAGDELLARKFGKVAHAIR